MLTSNPEPPAEQIQPGKTHVHVSVSVPWFVGIVVLLVCLAFFAGWLVPSPFSNFSKAHETVSPAQISPVQIAPVQIAAAGSLAKEQEKVIPAERVSKEHAAEERIPENPAAEKGAPPIGSNRLLDTTLKGDEIVETKAGTLHFTRIRITPPLEFIQQLAIEPEPRKWVFHNSLEELRKFLGEAGLTSEQTDALWATHSEEFGDNHVFRPDDKFVRSLKAEVKHQIYTRLGEDDRNTDQVNVYRFLGPSVEAWLEPAKLPPEVFADIKSLCYQHGPFWMFADLPMIWPQLPDGEARGRLLKALISEQTWRVSLWVNRSSDIDALAEYWGRGGRVNQVRPILEALAEARDGSGCGTSIGSILPPFVQTHLYTFPPPSQNTVEQQRDCHWTALNFFSAKLNDSFSSNPGAVAEEIRTHYTEIYANQALGDLILFATGEGENEKFFHSAVFITDDLIFTKNGRRAADPFMLMRLEEMKNYYPQTGKVVLKYFRRNDLLE